jgi:hypothetical protein
MSRPDPRNVCDGCGHVELGPIVHAHIWQQLAEEPREYLCLMCMGQRAWERLGRHLTLADLQPCSWNLFHRPHSWFDLFAAEHEPPSNLADWHSAARDLGIALPVRRQRGGAA